MPATTDAPHFTRQIAVREGVNRIEVTESQLITLLGLVREYTTDNELYNLLSEARP